MQKCAGMCRSFIVHSFPYNSDLPVDVDVTEIVFDVLDSNKITALQKRMGTVCDVCEVDDMMFFFMTFC
jgi:hypothetical protein